jgi:hypothetical protein
VEEDLQVCIAVLIGDGLPVCAVAQLLQLPKHRVRQIFYETIDAPYARTSTPRTGPVGEAERATIEALSRRGMPAPKIAHILRRRLKDVKQGSRSPYC